VRVDRRRPLNGSTLSGFGVAFALQSAFTIANACAPPRRHNAHVAVFLPSPVWTVRFQAADPAIALRLQRCCRMPSARWPTTPPTPCWLAAVARTLRCRRRSSARRQPNRLTPPSAPAPPPSAVSFATALRNQTWHGVCHTLNATLGASECALTALSTAGLELTFVATAATVFSHNLAFPLVRY